MHVLECRDGESAPQTAQTTAVRADVEVEIAAGDFTLSK